MRIVVCLSDCFDISIHFFFLISVSLITLFFLLPANFIFHNVEDKLLCKSDEDLGTLAENEPPTGYEPNDHFSTEAYVEYTQESTGEQRSPNETSTTMTSPSVRRSLMRAEDEPITLKKKACRPVCRRRQ